MAKKIITKDVDDVEEELYDFFWSLRGECPVNPVLFNSGYTRQLERVAEVVSEKIGHHTATEEGAHGEESDSQG